MGLNGRHFTLTDALVLIAATAVGLAMTRTLFAIDTVFIDIAASIMTGPRSSESHFAKSTWFVNNPTLVLENIERLPSIRLRRTVFRVVPCLTAWTLAVLAPRPARINAKSG
jgi:hypothetical protein